MTKGKLKAYLVSDKDYYNSTAVKWAETPGKAKSNTLYDDGFENCEYTELRAERAPYFDKYADSKKIPIKELLERGWWFYCNNCGCENLTIEDVQNGEAFITDKENFFYNEIQGGIICAKCKKKLEERLACG